MNIATDEEQSQRLDSSDAGDSAYDQLRQMDAQASINAMQSLAGASGAESIRDADPNNQYAASDGNPAGDSGEKRAGRDQVLRFLEENADGLPGGAATFRDLQRNVTDLGQRNSNTQARLEAIETHLSSSEGTPEEPDAQLTEMQQKRNLVDRLRPEQKAMLEAFAEVNGFVRQDDITEAETDRLSDEFTSQSIQEGLQLYGDDFGTMQDDQFVWNPDIKEEARSVLERITSDDTGITPMDLYWILRGRSGGPVSQANAQRQRVARGVNANTISRSAPYANRSNVNYNRERGDTLEDVTDRALLDALSS
jgi:hypothetical protein